MNTHLTTTTPERRYIGADGNKDCIDTRPIESILSDMQHIITQDDRLLAAMEIRLLRAECAELHEAMVSALRSIRRSSADILSIEIP